MNGKRPQNMFIHVQGQFTRQVSPPLQTREPRRAMPLAALHLLENQTVSCEGELDQPPRAIELYGIN